jgi:asparagine synthase (glutamine-hydrolysing)
MSHFGLMECLEDKPVVLEEKHSDPRSVVGELEASRYLRNQLLRDSDVMSMAHGLELRTPLVDARLWSFVKTLPPAVRFQPHKGALRNAVPGLDAIPPQGPKRGFTLPLQRWMDASWPGVSELKRLQRSLDLSHWSRKMAVISMTHHLGASKI